MKKVLAISLAVIMLVCFAACGSKTVTNGNVDGADVSYTDCVEVLTKVFDTYAEENKFPICGGDEANMSWEGPAKYDVALVEELNVVAHLPATQNANIEEAANVMNAMNANSFTGAAYLLKADADAAAFAADFKADLDNAQWMCGFPEKFVVIKTGSYIVTAYGLADNIDYFKTQATTALTAAEVVLEGNIAG